jgi:hypothetical protein
MRTEIVTLVALAALAVTPTVSAVNLDVTSPVPLPVTISCVVNPMHIECGVCTESPTPGPLPVSPGGWGYIGVGVSIDRDSNSGEFGPYTGVYVC